MGPRLSPPGRERDTRATQDPLTPQPHMGPGHRQANPRVPVLLARSEPMNDPEAPEEGNPEAQTDTAPGEASGGTGQEPDYSEAFSETFDPASLPPELAGAYKQMRDAFSQKTQTVAEERRQLQEYLESLQEDDDEEEEYEYEEGQADPYDQRIAALEEKLTAQTQAAEKARLEQAEHAFIVDGLQKLQKSTGRDFDDEELETIGLFAERLRDNEGYPDVQAAYERIYAQVLPKERERWKGKKNAPQAARGGTASESPDLDTPAGRTAFMAARLAEKNQE